MPNYVLNQEGLDAIKRNCEALKSIARKSSDREISYDEASILWLSATIETYRDKPDGKTKSGLAQMIGCFLGEAIIAKVGGQWISLEGKELAVSLTSGAIANPLGKVLKQFENGEADSIWGLYQLVTTFQ